MLQFSDVVRYLKKVHPAIILKHHKKQHAAPPPIEAEAPAPAMNEDYDLVLDFDVLQEVGDRGWPLVVPNSVAHEKMIAAVESLGPLADGEVFAQDVQSRIGKQIIDIAGKRTVAVVGLFDRGKTYVLNKIADTKLQSGKRVATRGLSFKVPLDPFMDQYVLLDTAGTNSPLEVPSGYRDLPTYSKEENKRIRNALMNRAIVNKKAVENFLQDMIFHLADVLIVVVNEMTWPDQQYIKVLSENIKTRAAESAASQRESVDSYRRLVVLHNFKDTTTEEEFEELRKKYVENCYVGTMQRSEIHLKNGISVPVERFVNEDQDMVHYFMAKDGSPAGMKHNEGTIQALRYLINEITVRPRGTITDILLSETKACLSGHFHSIESVNLTYHPEEKRLYMKAQGDIRLVKEEIVYDGVFLSLARPAHFAPAMDEIIVDGNQMVVLIDIPGFCLSQEAPQNYPCKLKIATTFDEVTIIGERRLAWKKHDEEFRECIPELRVYQRDEQGNGLILHRCERKVGVFERKIKVPSQFDASKMIANLSNGVLQISIPQKNIAALITC